MTEARITENSKSAGMLLRDINLELEKSDAQIIGLIRNERRIPAPSPYRELHKDDILLIEAEPEGLASVLNNLELTLEAEFRSEEANAEQKEEAREQVKAQKAQRAAEKKVTPQPRTPNLKKTRFTPRPKPAKKPCNQKTSR